MKLSELFERCLSIEYRQIENDASYALERVGNTLYIYFEHSRGKMDWLNNFDFPIKPYKVENKIWLAHRGFVRIFKSVEPYIAHSVTDLSIDSVIVVGYSHGGALAILCHEYVWYNRPDLRKSLQSYAFGAPRVIWGELGLDFEKRWQTLTVIRNLNDIVTHLPPKILGYTHVGNMLEIGQRGRYSMIDAHRPENILAELLEYEKNNGQ